MGKYVRQISNILYSELKNFTSFHREFVTGDKDEQIACLKIGSGQVDDQLNQYISILIDPNVIHVTTTTLSLTGPFMRFYPEN